MLENLFGVELSTQQKEVINNIDTHDYCALIFPEYGGRNHVLAMYILERAILESGKRIAVFSASFRHAKSLGEYTLSILKKTDVLRYTSVQDRDQIVIKIGKSNIVFRSVGDASRIRGQRANILIGIDVSSIDKDIRDNIVVGASLFHDKTKLIFCDYEEHLSDRFAQELETWKTQDNIYIYRPSRVTLEKIEM